MASTVEIRSLDSQLVNASNDAIVPAKRAGDAQRQRHSEMASIPNPDADSDDRDQPANSARATVFASVSEA